MKRLLKRIVGRAAGATHNVSPLKPRLASVSQQLNSAAGNEMAIQNLLRLQLRREWLDSGRLPEFHESEFRYYSQNGEDGILHLIFSLIGTTNKRVVEICCGDGVECNAANLIVNRGWRGLLFDGGPRNIDRARAFYESHPNTMNCIPRLRNAWITRKNVNKLIEAEKFDGEVDLLSLDLDGVDYWIWESLEAIKPRVVVVEYQDILGPERCVSVPYQDDFKAEFDGHEANYAGASLPAFVKLARTKGYRLVGCEELCFNAFFIRNDVGQDIFSEKPVSCGFTHPRVAEGIARRWPRVKDREWVEV